MVDKLYSTAEDEQLSKMPAQSTMPAYVPDRATQTLREYDERMGTRVQVPREATQVLPGAATQGLLEGLERDRQAAQEAAALRSEVQSELGAPMTRFVNEPVRETLRATPIVNYVVPGYTPSSATPYGQGGMSGGGGVVSVTPPSGAGAGAAQPGPSPMEQQLAKLEAYYAGMRGAPSVSMNEDMRRGIAGQQEALRGAVGAIEGEMPGQEQERAAMLSEGRQYVGDLERLRAQQAGQFAQRRERMAQDEAQVAQARQEFDPARILRQVGESPVSTAALSFAAGLVGALKGSAGQLGPNEILGEVDKAVERDTKTQLDKYQMLRDGIAVGQSNFNDMMRMGASEQQALAMTALASMDNHKRALEFAEQRIGSAKDKANLKGAISQLDFQRGKLKLDIDLKNAANWVAMNRARGEGMAKLVELRQKMQGMDPETRQKATQTFISLTGNERFDNAKEAAEGVGRVRALQKSIPIDRQKALWNTTVSKLIDEALTKTSAGAADKGDAVTGAVAQYLGAALEDQRFQSPEEKNMIALAQKLVNTELRRISGGSVTSGEAIRELLSRNWKSYDGFKNWIDLAEDQAMRGLQKYESAAAADPNVKSIMDGVLLPATMDIMDYRKFESDQAKLASGGPL